MARCDEPYHSGQDYLPSKKSPQSAGRLNRNQIHKKDCVYNAEKFGVYLTAKEVNKVFYKKSDLHFRLFCTICVENRLRRGLGYREQ